MQLCPIPLCNKHASPPTVLVTSPTNGATGVQRDSDITATFSEDVLHTTDALVFTVKNHLDVEVGGTVTYDSGSHTATYDPPGNLDFGETYTATITTAVTDLEGTAMSADKIWSFTAEQALYPVVLSTVPGNTGTNVVRDTLVTATFSENVTGVSGSSFKLWEGAAPGGTEVATVTVTYNSSTYVATMTLTPAGTKLNYNTQYWATLDHDLIMDEDLLKLSTQITGGVEQDKQWTFYTVSSIPAAVIDVTPDEDATNVPIASPIQVVFSKPVEATTLAGNITLELEGTPVSGTVSPSSGYTSSATFTPASPMEYMQTYTVTVSAGPTGIKDSDGTELSAPKTWSFTTFGFTKATITNNRLGAGGGASECLIFVPQSEPEDRVSVQVFTTTGKLVRTFYKNKAFSSVAVPIRWDGTNDKGQALGPGMYFVQIIAAGVKQTLKVLIVR